LPDYSVIVTEISVSRNYPEEKQGGCLTMATVPIEVFSATVTWAFAA
jgi:hypothetical protein